MLVFIRTYVIMTTAYLSQLTREGSVVNVKGAAPVVVCTASGILINLVTNYLSIISIVKYSNICVVYFNVASLCVV